MDRPKMNIRSWWARVRHREILEHEMDAEMRFHIDMEAERLMRDERLGSAEARRVARVRFGGVEKFKEAGRDTRGWQWLDAMSLDARLGVRMLAKYRWLTLVGGFAMAVAIAIVATVFEFARQVLNPALPLAEGDRVVTLQYLTAGERPERRVLPEFAAWRRDLTSIQEISAFRATQHNLVTGNAPEPIKVAEITASSFALARVSPLVGRYLLPSDEREGAPPVILIGYEAWHSRFAGDPQIVGRSMNLAGVAHEVVGVMPDGFKFPVNHQYWIPLRVNPATYRRWDGPELYVFGRLVAGATVETAQAEFASIARRVPLDHPQLDEQLRPLVLLYTRAFVDLTDPNLVLVVQIARFLIGALCVVVALNLAILVYARTATRLGEIAVRTALGATRRRILAQLFVEALALSLVGTVVGLVLARGAIDPVRALLLPGGTVPYWIDIELSWQTTVFSFGLAVLAAAIMGVLPGLKATGRRMHANLQELNGRTGTRLGPMWSGLVIVQVAIAVAVLPVALLFSWHVVRMEMSGAGFATEQFLVTVMTSSDDGKPPEKARREAVRRELMSRLQGEPGVTAVTFSSGVPGFGGDGRVQLGDGAASDDDDPKDVGVLHIDPDMFGHFGIPIVAGRGFSPSDLGAARSVIVNSTFVREVVGNRSPLGVRLRYIGDDNPKAVVEQADWYQIVGVVRDFPQFSSTPGSVGEPTVYHPAALGDIRGGILLVRFAGPVPSDAVERVRRIGADVAPSLPLRRVVPLSTYYEDLQSLVRYVASGIAAVTLSVLLLSAAGIYALMSFTVAQRTREIGIRAALGAYPHQLLRSIFARVLRQLAVGLMVGSLLAAGLMLAVDLEASRGAALLVVVAALMSFVAFLAAIGPARRSLHIPAMEALRTDG